MDLQHTFGHKKLRLRLVHVKVFPENRYFPEMLFSGKENVFMCLVAFQKMFQKVFSDVWLCSWKYHRKHIFYLLLTFSHIFSITKRIHNIIHSSKHKQNLEKNHQIRTNEGKIAIAIAIDADLRGGVWDARWSRRSARCRWSRRSFSLSLAECVLFVGFFFLWPSLSFARATENVWR